jgi:hypothetical protein
MFRIELSIRLPHSLRIATVGVEARDGVAECAFWNKAPVSQAAN